MPTQLFINNEFVDAKSGTTFKTINPATEEVRRFFTCQCVFHRMVQNSPA
jgi:acyl-CoA reductase-like NAD-dependent aldehyde dehydrogenase